MAFFTEWELLEPSTFVKHLREPSTEEEQGQLWQLLFHNRDANPERNPQHQMNKGEAAEGFKFRCDSFLILRLRTKASHRPGKHFITEPHPSPPGILFGHC